MTAQQLVVVVSQFPEPNETFIVREIAELRRRGFGIIVLSLKSRPRTINDPEARDLLPITVYPPGPLGILREALRTALRAPLRTVRAIARGVTDAIAAVRSPALMAKQLGVLPLVLAYARRLPPTTARLHAHFATVPTAAVRVLAAFRGTTYGFTAHAWDIYVPENMRQLPRRIDGADLVVTCTAHNREVLRGMAPSGAADRVQLCHHGLDFSLYAPGTTREAGLIVGGASLVEKKGLHHLLDACGILAGRGRGFRCVLVGEGPEGDRLRHQAKRLGLSDRVTFTGRLPHRDLVEWLRRAAVLAHPSVVDRKGSVDGIPNTILEAMAVETAVVATRLSGIPEVVVPGTTGLLVEPGDAEALADALSRVLDDDALARRLGSAGRRLVAERFDIGRNVERLAALLSR